MSNDNPYNKEKKGLLSGLGGLFKGKEKGAPSLPPQEAPPALRPPVEPTNKTAPSTPPPVTQAPVAGPSPKTPDLSSPAIPETSAAPTGAGQGSRSKHFRDEFEVFVSGKKRISKSSGAAEAPHIPRSQKPQVVKSADLSKEFDFFTKSSKSKNREASAAPARAVTAPPPAVVAPAPAPQAAKELTPPPPPVLAPSRKEEPVLKKPEPVLAPPPPPQAGKKEAPAEASKVVLPVASPTPAAEVKKPELPLPPPVKPETVSKPAPVLPPPALSVAPVADKKEEPPKVPVPPPIAAPVKATEKSEPLTIKKVELIDKSRKADPVAPTSKAPAEKVTIKKVELDASRKKRPVVVLPPVEDPAFAPPPVTGGVPASTPPAKKKDPVLAWVLAGIGLLLAVGLGFYIYQITRETSAEVLVSTNELTITGSPLIVYNFDGQVSQIKRDYAERRGPMEIRLQEIEGDLAAAKADLAGRLEKKRLLTGEIQKLKDSIPALAAEADKKLDRLWKEQGGALDKAYADQKEALHQEIEKRVESLGLKYQRNTELDALEVAVNAFRLSLYGAAKEINVDEQRVFSEDILKRWREFEKEWAQRQLEIKDEAMKIKLAPGPRIEITQKQMESLKVDLDALNVEIASLQEEVTRRQEEEVEEQEKLREAEKPFLTDLLKVPQNNILRELARDSDGVIRLKNLEKAEDMPPGDYLFFVQAQSGEEIFWAIKPLTISRHKKTVLEISRSDFVDIRKLIQ